MNRGQRLKQKRHRKALERAKYHLPVWERDGKGKKTTRKFWGLAVNLSAVRL